MAYIPMDTGMAMDVAMIWMLVAETTALTSVADLEAHSIAEATDRISLAA